MILRGDFLRRHSVFHDNFAPLKIVEILVISSTLLTANQSPYRLKVLSYDLLTLWFSTLKVPGEVKTQSNLKGRNKQMS